MAFDLKSTLRSLDEATAAQKLTADSAAMIRRWLTEPRYSQYAAEVAAHIAAGKWKQLDDVFWTVIPFGTGGRRGKMYPIGSNAINDRTIGESAQGVADYVAEWRKKNPPLPLGEGRGEGVANHAMPLPELSCAIAYDTRHNSRHFAELCAEIMAAAGFKVFFLDGFRSTPELSFAVRYTHSSCGIMVTASHNPPSDNAVKVYWAGGVQVLPPHDTAIIERVMNVGEIHRRPFAEALAAGQIVYCQAEVDPAFIAAVHSQALPGPRQLKIIYSPLHGVGASAVLPALAADGFKEVELFGPHAQPDGDFPNVPGHVANPENPAVFDIIIQRAQQIGADLILASDPDCDRLGAAAPLSAKPASAWKPFTGNQLAALLAEYVLSARKKAGTLSPQHYVVKTLVTTEMVRRIADHFGVQTHGNLQVGFKWIGQEIDAAGPQWFVFGCEESHGYLVGTHVRDKDAAVAAMLLAELAATCKAEGKTLHEKLDALYWQYGYHAEIQFSLTMPGAAGMHDMQKLMARLRSNPPLHLVGLKVSRVRDYLSLTQHAPGDPPQPLAGPHGDMVMLDLSSSGNYVAVRPSGTEPKVKFYMFTFEPAEQIANLDDTKAECAKRLENMQRDLSAFAADSR
jgi:phosphoglucomutase/phosphomannomutase